MLCKWMCCSRIHNHRCSASYPPTCSNVGCRSNFAAFCTKFLNVLFASASSFLNCTKRHENDGYIVSFVSWSLDSICKCKALPTHHSLCVIKEEGELWDQDVLGSDFPEAQWPQFLHDATRLSLARYAAPSGSPPTMLPLEVVAFSAQPVVALQQCCRKAKRFPNPLLDSAFVWSIT